MATADRLSGASFISLATLDPAAPLGDLEPLARLIPDDVRVVAVGESAHGAHEYYALRHRLARFLVERMDFTALTWESGFSEACMVDDWINGGGQGRDKVLAEGMTMYMGRCEEMADLFEWLRNRNASSARPVRFYGLDLPGAAATLKPALDIVEDYMKGVDPGAAVRLARLRELAGSFGTVATDKVTLVGTTVIQQYVAIPAADRNELTALLADMASRFYALRRSYVERSDAERYDLVRQHLRVARQLDLQLRAVAALMAGDIAACEANIRDRTMADTVEWVLGRHERVIVLAHNGHIQKTPVATPMGPIDTVGVHLASRLGDRYLTIGTTCGGGDIIAPRTIEMDGKQDTELVIRDFPPAEAGTIDHLLDASLAGTGGDASPSRIGLLDLRTLDPASRSMIDAARRMRMQDQVVEVDVRRAFDALIHVPRISLWTSPLNASMPDLRAGGAANR